MRKFVTDIDGCMLDWHAGFIKFCNELGFEINPESPRDGYDMDTWFIDMTREKFVELVSSFNEHHACEKYLAPIDNSNFLYDIKSDMEFEVIAFTAYGSTEAMKKKRTDLLDSMFPGLFDDIIIIGLGECKQDIIKQINPNHFVEDSPSHAKKAADVGVHTFLIDTTYNREVAHDRITRVSGWEEICSHLAK